MNSNRTGRRDHQQEAEAVGLAALVFMTEDETRLGHFLGETGLSPADLGRAAGEPHMLVAMLDHLLANESLLLVFAAGAGIEPATIAPLRGVLAGETGATGDTTQPTTRPSTKAASRRWRGPDQDAS